MAKKDFTRFRKEKEKDSPILEFNGKEYILPPTMRFEAVLAFKSLNERQKDETLNDMEVLDIFAALFGKRILDELMKEQEFDIDTASDMMKWALEQYGVSTADKEDNSTKK